MEIKNIEILKGKERLCQKLRNLETENLAISPYNKAYLKKHLKYLDYIMLLNGIILEDALYMKPGFRTLCDFGGGTGLLGLLAKESFGCEVIYADTYPEACKDVQTIAFALNLNIDHIIHGDVNALAQSELNSPDVMVSRDVIEHIYDLKTFFSITANAFPEMCQVHNTAANVYNVLKRKYFRRIHHQCEWDGDPENLKETDHQEPFYKLRFDWIRKHYHSINDEATHALAMITRGLTFEDMEPFVFLWLDGQRHEDPYHDRYLHNTCDPYNGNWAERLLYFDEYQSFASKYRCIFKGNPYNTDQHKAGLNPAARLLNLCIKNGGNSAKFLWPSFNLLMKPI